MDWLGLKLTLGRSVRHQRIKHVSMEDAIWLFSSFCTLHRLTFDATLLAQRYPPPMSVPAFADAASELGLTLEQHAGSLNMALARRLPLAIRLQQPQGAPAAAKVEPDSVVRPSVAPTPSDEIHPGLNDGHTQHASSDEPSVTGHWAMVLNADDSRVVLIERGMSAPVVVELDELRQRYLGTAWSLTPRQAKASDPDDIEHRQARFGLHWFVPELLKHKTVWRDVLTASLVLQLMGLALPLFTQVIIDKVVVHRTQSTLISLGIAMAVFLLFNSGLSWIRQYLILHTGQRIDAILASQVFDKLFRLPLLYFQHRPTGVISARLQGIEAIGDGKIFVLDLSEAVRIRTGEAGDTAL